VCGERERRRKNSHTHNTLGRRIQCKACECGSILSHGWRSNSPSLFTLFHPILLLLLLNTQYSQIFWNETMGFVLLAPILSALLVSIKGVCSWKIREHDETFTALPLLTSPLLKHKRERKREKKLAAHERNHASRTKGFRHEIELERKINESHSIRERAAVAIRLSVSLSFTLLFLFLAFQF
jgi:hypothetical protein